MDLIPKALVRRAKKQRAHEAAVARRKAYLHERAMARKRALPKTGVVGPFKIKLKSQRDREIVGRATQRARALDKPQTIDLSALRGVAATQRKATRILDQKEAELKRKVALRKSLYPSAGEVGQVRREYKQRLNKKKLDRQNAKSREIESLKAKVAPHGKLSGPELFSPKANPAKQSKLLSEAAQAAKKLEAEQKRLEKGATEALSKNALDIGARNIVMRQQKIAKRKRLKQQVKEGSAIEVGPYTIKRKDLAKKPKPKSKGVQDINDLARGKKRTMFEQEREVEHRAQLEKKIAQRTPAQKEKARKADAKRQAKENRPKLAVDKGLVPFASKKTGLKNDEFYKETQKNIKQRHAAQRELVRRGSVRSMDVFYGKAAQRYYDRYGMHDDPLWRMAFPEQAAVRDRKMNRTLKTVSYPFNVTGHFAQQQLQHPARLLNPAGAAKSLTKAVKLTDKNVQADWKNIVGQTLGAEKIPYLGGAATVTLGLAGNLVMDPLNLISFGTAGVGNAAARAAVRQAVKGAMESAAKETAVQAGHNAGMAAVRSTFGEGATRNLRRYMKNPKKGRGLWMDYTPEKLAKMEEVYNSAKANGIKKATPKEGPKGNQAPKQRKGEKAGDYAKRVDDWNEAERVRLAAQRQRRNKAQAAKDKKAKQKVVNTAYKSVDEVVNARTGAGRNVSAKTKMAEREKEGLQQQFSVAGKKHDAEADAKWAASAPARSQKTFGHMMKHGGRTFVSAETDQALLAKVVGKRGKSVEAVIHGTDYIKGEQRRVAAEIRREVEKMAKEGQPPKAIKEYQRKAAEDAQEYFSKKLELLETAANKASKAEGRLERPRQRYTEKPVERVQPHMGEKLKAPVVRTIGLRSFRVPKAFDVYVKDGAASAAKNPKAYALSGHGVQRSLMNEGKGSGKKIRRLRVRPTKEGVRVIPKTNVRVSTGRLDVKLAGKRSQVRAVQRAQIADKRLKSRGNHLNKTRAAGKEAIDTTESRFARVRETPGVLATTKDSINRNVNHTAVPAGADRKVTAEDVYAQSARQGRIERHEAYIDRETYGAWQAIKIDPRYKTEKNGSKLQLSAEGDAQLVDDLQNIDFKKLEKVFVKDRDGNKVLVEAPVYPGTQVPVNSGVIRIHKLMQKFGLEKEKLGIERMWNPGVKEYYALSGTIKEQVKKLERDLKKGEAKLRTEQNRQRREIDEQLLKGEKLRTKLGKRIARRRNREENIERSKAKRQVVTATYKTRKKVEAGARREVQSTGATVRRMAENRRRTRAQAKALQRVQPSDTALGNATAAEKSAQREAAGAAGRTSQRRTEREQIIEQPTTRDRRTVEQQEVGYLPQMHIVPEVSNTSKPKFATPSIRRWLNTNVVRHFEIQGQGSEEWASALIAERLKKMIELGKGKKSVLVISDMGDLHAAKKLVEHLEGLDKVPSSINDLKAKIKTVIRKNEDVATSDANLFTKGGNDIKLHQQKVNKKQANANKKRQAQKKEEPETDAAPAPEYIEKEVPAFGLKRENDNTTYVKGLPTGHAVIATDIGEGTWALLHQTPKRLVPDYVTDVNFATRAEAEKAALDYAGSVWPERATKKVKVSQPKPKIPEAEKPVVQELEKDGDGHKLVEKPLPAGSHPDLDPHSFKVEGNEREGYKVTGIPEEYLIEVEQNADNSWSVHYTDTTDGNLEMTNLTPVAIPLQETANKIALEFAARKFTGRSLLGEKKAAKEAAAPKEMVVSDAEPVSGVLMDSVEGTAKTQLPKELIQSGTASLQARKSIRDQLESLARMQEEVAGTPTQQSAAEAFSDAVNVLASGKKFGVVNRSHALVIKQMKEAVESLKDDYDLMDNSLEARQEAAAALEMSPEEFKVFKTDLAVFENQIDAIEAKLLHHSTPQVRLNNLDDSIYLKTERPKKRSVNEEKQRASNAEVVRGMENLKGEPPDLLDHRMPTPEEIDAAREKVIELRNKRALYSKEAHGFVDEESMKKGRRTGQGEKRAKRTAAEREEDRAKLKARQNDPKFQKIEREITAAEKELARFRHDEFVGYVLELAPELPRWHGMTNTDMVRTFEEMMEDKKMVGLSHDEMRQQTYSNIKRNNNAVEGLLKKAAEKGGLDEDKYARLEKKTKLLEQHIKRAIVLEEVEEGVLKRELEIAVERKNKVVGMSAGKPQTTRRMFTRVKDGDDVYYQLKGTKIRVRKDGNEWVAYGEKGNKIYGRGPDMNEAVLNSRYLSNLKSGGEKFSVIIEKNKAISAARKAEKRLKDKQKRRAKELKELKGWHNKIQRLIDDYLKRSDEWAAEGAKAQQAYKTAGARRRQATAATKSSQKRLGSLARREETQKRYLAVAEVLEEDTRRELRRVTRKLQGLNNDFQRREVSRAKFIEARQTLADLDNAKSFEMRPRETAAEFAERQLSLGEVGREIKEQELALVQAEYANAPNGSELKFVLRQEEIIKKAELRFFQNIEKFGNRLVDGVEKDARNFFPNFSIGYFGNTSGGLFRSPDSMKDRDLIQAWGADSESGQRSIQLNNTLHVAAENEVALTMRGPKMRDRRSDIKTWNEKVREDNPSQMIETRHALRIVREQLVRDANKIELSKYLGRVFFTGRKYHGQKLAPDEQVLSYHAGEGLTRYSSDPGPLREALKDAASGGYELRILTTSQLKNVENALLSRGWVGKGASRAWFNLRSAISQAFITLWPGSWVRNVIGDSANELLGGTGLVSALGGWKNTAATLVRHFGEKHSIDLRPDEKAFLKRPGLFEAKQGVYKRLAQGSKGKISQKEVNLGRQEVQVHVRTERQNGLSTKRVWMTEENYNALKAQNKKVSAPDGGKLDAVELVKKEDAAGNKIVQRRMSGNEQVQVQRTTIDGRERKTTLEWMDKGAYRDLKKKEGAKVKLTGEKRRVAQTQTVRVDKRRKFAVKNEEGRKVYRTRMALLAEANNLSATGGFAAGELKGVFGRHGTIARTAAARESAPRIGSFIEHRRSYTPREALERTNKYHFNYQQLTKAEKMLRDAMFPFLTWTVRNLRLQLGELVRHTSAYNSMLRVINMQAQEAGYKDVFEAAQEIDPFSLVQLPIPLYGKRGEEATSLIVALPMGSIISMFGKVDRNNMNAVVESPADVLGNVKDVAVGLLHPAIKGIGELVTGKDFYFGENIGSYVESGGAKSDIEVRQPVVPWFLQKIVPDPLKKLAGWDEYFGQWHMSSGWEKFMRSLGPEAQALYTATTPAKPSASVSNEKKLFQSVTGLRTVKTGYPGTIPTDSQGNLKVGAKNQAYLRVSRLEKQIANVVAKIKRLELDEVQQTDAVMTEQEKLKMQKADLEAEKFAYYDLLNGGKGKMYSELMKREMIRSRLEYSDPKYASRIRLKLAQKEKEIEQKSRGKASPETLRQLQEHTQEINRNRPKPKPLPKSNPKPKPAKKKAPTPTPARRPAAKTAPVSKSTSRPARKRKRSRKQSADEAFLDAYINGKLTYPKGSYSMPSYSSPSYSKKRPTSPTTNKAIQRLLRGMDAEEVLRRLAGPSSKL